jgi:hypothetical protein
MLMLMLMLVIVIEIPLATTPNAERPTSNCRRLLAKQHGN